MIKFFGRWGELESGQTTIAFTPLHQHETDDLTGRVQTPGSRGERQPIEVCFAYPDVDAAYKVYMHSCSGSLCDLHETIALVVVIWFMKLYLHGMFPNKLCTKNQIDWWSLRDTTI